MDRLKKKQKKTKNFEIYGTLKQGDHICNNFKNHAADLRQVDLQKVNDLLIHRAKAWILASSDIDLFSQHPHTLQVECLSPFLKLE